MKLFLFIILILVPLEVDGISASSYIVMDTDNERILEGQNMHTPYLTASIANLMTTRKK